MADASATRVSSRTLRRLRTHGDTNKRKVLVGREPSLMIRRCIEIGLTSCRHLHVVTHIRGGAARINAAAAIVPDGISCHRAFSRMSQPPHAHRAPRPVPAISDVQSLLGRPPPSTASLALVFAGERCWARRGSLDLARARCWIHCCAESLPYIDRQDLHLISVRSPQGLLT